MSWSFLKKPWPNGTGWMAQSRLNSRRSWRSAWMHRDSHPPSFSGHPDRYKIKLRSIGYRLVYEVQDGRLVVLVVAVGKRDKNAVYRAAEGR